MSIIKFVNYKKKKVSYLKLKDSYKQDSAPSTTNQISPARVYNTKALRQLIPLPELLVLFTCSLLLHDGFLGTTTLMLLCADHFCRY